MALLYFRFKPYLSNLNLKLSRLKVSTGPDVDRALTIREAHPIPLKEFLLTPEEELHHKSMMENYIDSPKEVDMTPISFVPRRLLDTRVARIHKLSKNAMQSGTHNTKYWRASFGHEKRWDSQLMGWCAGADSLSCVVLHFDTAADAVRHCDRNGWDYYIEDPCQRKHKMRKYGDNFLWGRRCRVSTK